MQNILTRDKIIVLYTLNYCESELSNSSLSEILLEMDDIMNYFRLQTAISGLEDTGFIKVRSAPGITYYQITPDGKTALTHLKSELSQKILDRLNRLLDSRPELKGRSPRSLADYYMTHQGGYAVRCRIIRNNVSQMELTLDAPSEEAARTICLNWPQKSQKVYETIMEELL